MNEQRPPGPGVYPDGEGHYLIVGTPVPLALALHLGANPGHGDEIVSINRQIVDHYRNPKSRRLWQQAMWDRADLRHRLRLAEAEVQRLKGHTRTMTNDLKWRRSSVTPIVHTGGMVEIAEPEEGTILVRNSDHPAAVLEFTSEEWTAFLEGVDLGEFDIDDNAPGISDD